MRITIPKKVEMIGIIHLLADRQYTSGHIRVQSEQLVYERRPRVAPTDRGANPPQF